MHSDATEPEPVAAPIPRAASVLCLLAWATVVASAILEGAVCHWQLAELTSQITGYKWQTSSLDSTAASLLATLAGSVALCSYPAIGIVLGAAFGIVTLVKVVCLAAAGAAPTVLATAATALISCVCAAAAGGVALTTKPGGDARAEKLLEMAETGQAAPREVSCMHAYTYHTIPTCMYVCIQAYTHTYILEEAIPLV